MPKRLEVAGVFHDRPKVLGVLAGENDSLGIGFDLGVSGRKRRIDPFRRRGLSATRTQQTTYSKCHKLHRYPPAC